MNIGMAGTKLADFFTKEGLKKAGQQAVKAATSEGVKQAGKRAVRDTLLYSAAEQVIPRALGANAPDIKDTLVRQAAGNIVAEGATAGLKKAFPVRAAGADPSQMNMFTGKKEGKNLFGMLREVKKDDFGEMMRNKNNWLDIIDPLGKQPDLINFVL